MVARRLAPLVAALALAGCAQTQSAYDSVKTTLTRATSGPSTTSATAGDIRNSDKYCASLEESYEVADNVWRIIQATGTQALVIWRDSGFQVTGQTRRQVEAFVKELSRRYLWMPVFVEEQIGTYLHDEYPKDKIVGRGGRGRDRRAYERADRALAAAVRDYDKKLPYELKLFVVESDVINAEALPAGYVYVSRKATTDLDETALTLILGHEVAHVAKRHTSKQIQQRIVDTGMGADMLQQVIQNRGTAVDRKMLSSWNLVAQLQGLFARYDQDQELQADACSIRGLVHDGKDPIKARAEYLRMRGGESGGKPAPPGSRPLVSQAFGLSFTEHPDDDARQKFFEEATAFHRKGTPATRVAADAAAIQPVPAPAAEAASRPAVRASPPAAPPACTAIPFETPVRSDAEPLFTRLSGRDRRKLQTAVCLSGGDVDGAWGPRTKHSLKQYECRTGHEPTGALTAALVTELLTAGPDEIAKRCAAR